MMTLRVSGLPSLPGMLVQNACVLSPEAIVVWQQRVEVEVLVVGAAAAPVEAEVMLDEEEVETPLLGVG